MDERIGKKKVSLDHKTILVTGGAGFIGSNLIQRLLREFRDITVINIDSMTDYNPIKLKEWRLQRNEEAARENQYVFVRGDISDRSLIDEVFSNYQPAVLVNLAAQAGTVSIIQIHISNQILSGSIIFWRLVGTAMMAD